MSDRITGSHIMALLRSNTALFLLCFISLGVLAILVRGNDNYSSRRQVRVAVDNSGGPQAEGLARSPLRDMPAPSVYKAFAYDPEKPIEIDGTCSDAYRVIMIFPDDVDYRTDSLSAKYNTAVPCDNGKKYEEIIATGTLNLENGKNYYIIRASEGKKGSWHDPY